MTAETARAADLAARSLDAIAEDRRVPMAYGVSRDAYLAVREETDALAWQLAEMPAHQLHYTAEFLAGLLEREPLASRPTLEPPRVVLGLLLLAIEQVSRRIGTDDEASLATLRPPAYEAAVARVNEFADDILADVDRDLLAERPSPDEIDAFFAAPSEETMPDAAPPTDPDDAPPA